MIEFFVDGSCKGNGKINNTGGFGVIIVDTEINKAIFAYNEFSNNTTNNREELKAINFVMFKYGAPQFLDESKIPIVYSDSAYSINTLETWMFNWQRNGWIKSSDHKEPENLDLIKPYFEHRKKGFRIILKKVKGHDNIFWNEIVDKLATGKITQEEVLAING